MAFPNPDPCGDDNESRLARHRAPHNIGLPPHPEVVAQRAALGNCQMQLQIAIRHLQKILNTSRTATESWQAEQDARQWLESIGSEPGDR